MKKLLFVICVGLFLNMTLNAQVSTYLEKGQSGAGISLNYEGAAGSDGVFGILSYSHKGILDLSVCVNQTYFNKYEEDLMNLDATDLYYSGELTWWLLREKVSPSIEANFGINLGVERANYKNYSYIGGSYNGYFGGWVGISTSVCFNLPNKWTLQPMMFNYYGFGNDFNTQLVSGGATLETKEFYYGAVSFLGASLSKKFDSGNSLFFSFMQGLTNYNSNSDFNVGLGYVIAL